MPLWAGFINGSNTERSGTLDAEQTVNWYPHLSASQANAKQAFLYPSPGLKPWLTVTDIGCRGLWSMDGRTFAVVGTTLYELDLALTTATVRGTIAADTSPVSWASNGRGGEQLAIVGGGHLYIFSLTANTLTGPVTLPFTGRPVEAKFLDGYVLILEQGTPKIWYSALEDATAFDALDFFARSDTPDNLVGIEVIRDRIWRFGSQTTDVAYNSGDSDNPFQPYPGSVMATGLVSPWAKTVINDAPYWVAQDSTGATRIVTAGASVQDVSTPAVAFALGQYPTVSDCEALSYTQDGHTFACFTFPSAGDAGVTWAYDLTTQQWTERASFDVPTGSFYRWRARGLASTSAGLLVGDYNSGELYTLDLDTFTDGTRPVRRLRRASYLASEATWLFLDQMELGIQAGVGTGNGNTPQLALTVSRDNGQTWTSAGFASVGQQGEYLQRAVWRRLGRTRADRLVMEVATTANAKVVLGPGAWLRATPGSGQL